MNKINLSPIEKANMKIAEAGLIIIVQAASSNGNFVLKCKEGHEYSINVTTILRSAECLVCKKNRANQKKIQMMHELALSKEGQLISKSWVDWDEQYEWVCSKGHSFRARVNHIKKGTWCPDCKKVNRQEKIKERLIEIVSKKNGKIQFGKAKTSTDKVMLACSEGHTWTTSISYLLSGSWCGSCYHIKSRASLTEFKEIAKRKDGECLSKSYVGAIFKLRFRCKDGHVWEATGNSIKNGSWCGVCDRIKRQGILNKGN